MTTNELKSMLYDIVKDKQFECHKDTVEKMIKKQYIKNKHFDIHELDSEYYVFIKRVPFSTIFGKNQNGALSDGWKIFMFKRDALFNSYDSEYDGNYDSRTLVHYIYNESAFFYKASYSVLDVLYTELLSCIDTNDNIRFHGSTGDKVDEDFKIIMNKLISNDIDMLNGDL